MSRQNYNNYYYDEQTTQCLRKRKQLKEEV